MGALLPIAQNLHGNLLKRPMLKNNQPELGLTIPSVRVTISQLDMQKNHNLKSINE